MRIITIDKQSVKPIYKQIVNEVETAILNGKLLRNDRLPSVNKVCLENNISRDTVLLAFDALKKRGVIYAIPGKGYFVKTTLFPYEQRYFLLFDELNAFKEDIYNAFMEALEGRVQVDIFFHHFNSVVFKKLIHDANGNYSNYIIMPSNLQGVEESIYQLPPEEVYILDQTRSSLNQYPAIFQNFVSAMYNGLKQGKEHIEKYNQFVLLFPGNKEPIGMVDGFLKFCTEFELSHEVIASFDTIQPVQGTLYIIPDDRHLVDVVEKTAALGLVIGAQIGIISYNDIPLKKIIAGGITTISTDFSAMGKQLAAMVLSREQTQIENPSKLILRNSL